MQVKNLNRDIEEKQNEITEGLIHKYDFTIKEAQDLITEWSFEYKQEFVAQDIVDLEQFYKFLKNKPITCGLFHFLGRPKLTNMGTYFCVFNEHFVVEDYNTKEILLYDSIPDYYTASNDLICGCSTSFIQFMEFFLLYREWYISNFSNIKFGFEKLNREELISILGGEKYAKFLELSSINGTNEA